MIFRSNSSARRSTAGRVTVPLPAYVAAWQRQRLAPHLAAAFAVAAPQGK